MTQKTFDATSWWRYFAKKEHPDKFREKIEAKQKKEEAEKTRKRAREQQPTIIQQTASRLANSNYAIFKNWATGSENEQNLERKIGEFIALDCQPFSVVEDEG
uniref:Uncharacterized protein n=1 Tax=Globodera rostochiensis TaxID=31243 RepID=A0A914HNE1_GLORO